MGELDPTFVAWLIPLSFVGFVVTSAVGLGSAIFLIPLLMLRLPAAEAVSLAAPIALVGNVSRAAMLREHIDARAAWIVTLTSAPVAALTAYYMVEVDPYLLKRTVGALVLLSLLLDSVHPGVLKIGPSGLAACGIVSGALSGLAGLAGPPGVIALRAYGLSAATFVATMSVWGVALQVTKIPPYLASGAMPFALVPLALCMGGLSFVGAWVATRFLATMPTERFRLLLQAALAVVALWLLGEDWLLARW